MGDDRRPAIGNDDDLKAVVEAKIDDARSGRGTSGGWRGGRLERELGGKTLHRRPIGWRRKRTAGDRRLFDIKATYRTPSRSPPVVSSHEG